MLRDKEGHKMDLERDDSTVCCGTGFDVDSGVDFGAHFGAGFGVSVSSGLSIGLGRSLLLALVMEFRVHRLIHALIALRGDGGSVDLIDFVFNRHLIPQVAREKGPG